MKIAYTCGAADTEQRIFCIYSVYILHPAFILQNGATLTNDKIVILGWSNPLFLQF